MLHPGISQQNHQQNALSIYYWPPRTSTPLARGHGTRVTIESGGIYALIIAYIRVNLGGISGPIWRVWATVRTRPRPPQLVYLYVIYV